MNIYFIDTLELTYSSDFDDIIKLTKNFKMVDPKKGAGNKEFIVARHAKSEKRKNAE